MKFAKTLKNIFIALTILSVISLSSAKKSSRSKATVHDDVVAAKVITYEAVLTIKDAVASEEHTIKIDQESFNVMNYGIQFSMEKGAIVNPAFFLVAANNYLFDFKYSHSFNCLNQALFTENAMHFAVYSGKKSYDIVFTFPNGWAFGSDVNILSLCNKFYANWTSSQAKRSELESQIMKIYSHIKLLEMTRANNQNTKAGLQTQNGQLDMMIQQTKSTIASEKKEITKISEDINKIGQKSSAQSQILGALSVEIKTQEAKMSSQQNFIEETKGDITHIRKITTSEINTHWELFKTNLEKMINIYSDEDPDKKRLQDYAGNIHNYETTIFDLIKG